MKTVIEYFETYTFVDILSIIFLVCTIVICVEKTCKWCWNMFIKAYNKKRGKEEEFITIDNLKLEIKELSIKIDEFANLMNRQYLHLEKKIDGQVERLNDFEKSSEKRDASLLRDRIIQGTRFFKKNVGEDGFVHISVADHDSLEHLFQDYFDCGGNGTVKSIYNNEFKTWKIDG